MYNEFRFNGTSTSDAKPSGRPNEVVTPVTIERIYDMMLAVWRLRVRESVVLILNDHCCMQRLSAGWVLRVLTITQKRNLVIPSKVGVVQPQSENVFESWRQFVGMHVISATSITSKKSIPLKMGKQLMANILLTDWIDSATI